REPLPAIRCSWPAANTYTKLAHPYDQTESLRSKLTDKIEVLSDADSSRVRGGLVDPRPRKVLILGGGFGGVTVAQELEKFFSSDPSVEVTLVSRDNYLLFVPMLPEVASGAIEITHILSP